MRVVRLSNAKSDSIDTAAKYKSTASTKLSKSATAKSRRRVTGVIDRRPLVLLGDCWKPVVKCWQENLPVSDRDVSFLDFAETAEQACAIIIEKSKGVVITKN